MWRDSMERSAEGLLIVRPSREILYANPVAGLLLGQASAELAGTRLAHPVMLGSLSRITVPHGMLDPVTLEASCVAIEWESDPAWLITLRDVTTPHRAQSLKTERVKMLERMAQGVALADILIGLVQFVESQYPQSICTVMLLDPDGLRLRYGASTQLPRPLIEVADGISVGPDEGSCGTAAHERRVVVVTDIATDPRWAKYRDVALDSGIRACWSIPIFSSTGEVIGTFANYYRTPRAPAIDEMELVGACAQITGVAVERHRAEAQLKLLESSIAHLNDMIIITDASPIDEPGPRMMFFNDALLRHTGYTREQLIGKSPRVFQGELTDRGELDRIHDALAMRQPVRAELINYKANGEQFWVELDITTITDARGRASHFVSVQRDISAYKRIQMAMQRSDERFKMVAKVSTDVIWDWNLLTDELWWSEGMQTLFGHPAETVEPGIESWIRRIHVDDRDRVVDGIHAVINAGGHDWHDEYRFQRGDGSHAHVSDRGYVTHADDGRAIRMVGGIRDVSERHAAEADVRRMSQSQSLIIRAQRQIAEAGLDLAGVMQLIAQRAQELSGASGAAIVCVEDGAFYYRAVSGSTYAHLNLRIQRERSLAGLAMRENEAQLCLDTENDPRVDAEACRKVGARSLMCVPLNREHIDDAVVAVISNRPDAFDSRDLANLQILADSLGAALERERNAAELKHSESNYRLLFDSNPQPMLVYDAQTLAFLAVNAAAIAHYGYSEEEFLRLRVIQLHPADEADVVERRLHDAPTKPRHGEQWRHQLKNGSIIDVEIASDAISFAGRQARLVVVLDISRRMHNERQLARISRASLMLSHCNEALLRAETEHDLLEAVCRIGVDTGGYRMTWVGLALDDAAKTVRHAACAGEGLGYLQGMLVSWDADSPAGSGPSGRTIREGRAVVIEEIARSPGFARWAQAAEQHGFRACVSLPLRDGERTFGNLSFYSAVALPINDEELNLLQELADNLAYGMGNLRARRERQRLQDAVTRVASVSTGDEQAFFGELVAAMVDAVRADAGGIVRLRPGMTPDARLIAGIVDGQRQPPLDFDVSGTACDQAGPDAVRVIGENLAACIGRPPPLLLDGAQAYAGRRFDAADGTPLGVLFVLSRKPIRQVDFMASSLGIFAIRAAAELQRQDADARLRDQASLLDKSRDAIIAGDLDHRITYWNKGAERLYGWTSAEIIGVSNIEQVYLDPSVVQEILAELLSHDKWHGRLQQRRKDGRVITVDAHSSLIRDDGGAPRFFMVIASEVSDP
jgi:PAS domain S-box-containing protein